MMKNKLRYFRNINEIDVYGPVDPDSLWCLDGERLVLVDDDQYVIVDYPDHKNKFREVYDQN